MSFKLWNSENITRIGWCLTVHELSSYDVYFMLAHVDTNRRHTEQGNKEKKVAKYSFLKSLWHKIFYAAISAQWIHSHAF